jgi:hypothetical protein
VWWTVINLSNTGLLRNKVKVKRKMSPVCIPWRFLKLGTRLYWVLCLTLCPVYVWGKSPWYTSNTRLVAAWSQFRCQVNKHVRFKIWLCVLFLPDILHIFQIQSVGNWQVVGGKYCSIHLHCTWSGGWSARNFAALFLGQNHYQTYMSS